MKPDLIVRGSMLQMFLKKTTIVSCIIELIEQSTSQKGNEYENSLKVDFELTKYRFKSVRILKPPFALFLKFIFVSFLLNAC